MIKSRTNVKRPIVGIDLGTTNSAVAFVRKGKPDIFPSPEGHRIIPSVIHVTPKGQIIVGTNALSAKVAMPSRTISSSKRLMGSKTEIPFGEKTLLPQEAAALVLKELKHFVDTALGEGEKEAVITVPAYFTDEQRRATKEAGELAGFVVERIINEPTAAALAFGYGRKKADGTLLVYDLGGGTFDVSIVDIYKGIIEVKASAGNNALGGEDFDWLLVDWMAKQMLADYEVDPRNDPRARALLKERAEEAKKELSFVKELSIDIPLVCFKEETPLGFSAVLSREIFISLIQAMLDETMQCVEKVLKDASIQPSDVDEVLLVGGSTRIPRVPELLTEFFSKKPRNDIHPDECVALGAAIQGALKSRDISSDTLIVTDVAPFSMGIAVLTDTKAGRTKPGGFSVIIPRNTTVPTEKTQRYWTSHPGQTQVAIEIFQGENPWVKDNHFLGEFLLTGVPSNTQAQEGIDVTFTYNINGILEVTAEAVTNGKSMEIMVDDELNRDSEEAFNDSLKRIEDLIANQTPESIEEEIPLEIDPVLLQGMDRRDSFEDLLQDANRIRQEIEKAKPVPAKYEETLAYYETRLDEAVVSNDTEELEGVLDQITDFLIDMETDEEGGL